MPSLWIDDQLIELAELSDRDRAFVASRWAPTASVVLRAKWLEDGQRIDGRTWILRVAEVLRLDLDLSRIDLVAGSDRELVVALVGPELSDAIAGPKTDSRAVLRLLPLTAPPEIPHVIRLATSQWRHNNLSPVSGVLFASDNEYWVQRNAARESGFDEALVLDLNGDVSRAGRGAVFARIDDGVVTPPPGSGAPLTPWRHLAVEALEAFEQPLTPDLLRSCSSAFVVDEYGGIAAVGAIDGFGIGVDHDLISKAKRGLQP